MEILAYLLGIIAIALALTVSVGLHELGHMVAAKAFGVKVTEYMIGFGRLLWSKRVGETEYGIKLWPLGGYTAMTGMYPPASETKPYRGPFSKLVRDSQAANDATIVPGEEPRAFYRLPVWKRLVVMVAGIAANFVLALICFAVLVMGIGVVSPTTTVGSVSKCVLPASTTQTSCKSGDPAAPGVAAGLRAGDRIVAVDGQRITDWVQLQQAIQPRAGKSTALDVVRNGEQLRLTLTPAVAQRYIYDASGQPRRGSNGKYLVESVGFIGITPTEERMRQSAGAVVPAAWSTVSQSAQVILHLPARLVSVAQSAFGGKPRAADTPMSIVGVGRVAGEVASSTKVSLLDKVATFVGLTASLNIALALFNLVPLIPLDGGHAAGALWDGLRRWWARVRGRPDPGPFDASRLTPLTIVVVVCMFAMGGLLVFADLVSPISLFG